MDDDNGWSGKNTSMTWQLAGSKTILVPFASTKKFVTPHTPDGSSPRVIISLRSGFELPGFQGAPWCPVDVTWHSRPVWIVEMFPKDSRYDYGRQLLYVDRDVYTPYFKEIYDRAGRYWKTLFAAYRYQCLSNGKVLIGSEPNLMVGIDEKRPHATVINGLGGELNLPVQRLGPSTFTMSHILQLSK